MSNLCFKNHIESNTGFILLLFSAVYQFTCCFEEPASTKHDTRILLHCIAIFSEQYKWKY